MMKKQLLSVNEVSELINKGNVLLLAGDENLLSNLPEGNWIGGTSANFMTSDGGISCQDKIYVTDITAIVQDHNIKTFTPQNLKEISKGHPENGFVVIIVPGLSEIHAQFAKEVQEYEGIFNTPLVGWISGINVAEIGKRTPKVFAGSKNILDNEAVVMYVNLPQDMLANLNIINLFSQEKGANIEFKEAGFSSENCFIDGVEKNLAAYITENNIDTKLPLVADYNGAMINVSFQSVDNASGKVQFYAPVFPNVTYRIAAPVESYIDEFNQSVLKNDIEGVTFSCNCILNFLYAELEGKKTGDLVGPITFGEIAYMLLNQTLVYLTIQKNNV